MKKKLKEREFRIWLVWAMTIVIVWGVTVGMFYDSHKNSRKVFLDTELKRFKGEVNSTLRSYEEFSNYIYDQMNQDEEIISIIYEANSASDEEKELLRQRLYNKLSKRYLSMQKYKFRQLHFHLPDTESFLRVHSPEKYGDLLLNYRESVRLVNENKTKISGFEEGKIFNGFRNVYPLKYNDEHIGSVEISMSSASIIEILSELHKNKDFYFIIKKSIVEENLFKDEIDNYQDSNIFDDYYVDIEVEKFTSEYNTIKADSVALFFRNIKEKHMEDLKNMKSFSTVYKFEGQDYTVNFLGIENFKQIPSAYLISISESLGYREFIQDMYKEISLVTLLAFFVITFGFLLSVYQYELRDSAELDYLTNLYNRNKFYEIANREMKCAKRYKQETSIMFIDIDFFKKINDTYGHEWGDQVLKKLAKKISSNIREVDIFARWGGEEFVILLPNTGKKGALIVAEKIRKLIDESQSKELKDITISIGVSLIDSENYNINAGINLADEAMYEAKKNGRNQVFFK